MEWPRPVDGEKGQCLMGLFNAPQSLKRSILREDLLVIKFVHKDHTCNLKISRHTIDPVEVGIPDYSHSTVTSY